MTEEQVRELHQLTIEGDKGVADLFMKYRDSLERILSHFDSMGAFEVESTRRMFCKKPILRSAKDTASTSTHLPFRSFVWLRQRVLQKLIDIQREHFRDKRDANLEVRYVAGTPARQPASPSPASC